MGDCSQYEWRVVGEGWREGGALHRSTPHPPLATSNDGSIRHDGPARDDDDAVANYVVLAFGVAQAALVDDSNVRANAAVFVHDGSFDGGVVADGEIRDAA